MPPFPKDGSKDFLVRVRSREFIDALGQREGLAQGAIGLTRYSAKGEPTAIYVPPLEAPEHLEVWRHEIRHALEGAWHP